MIRYYAALLAFILIILAQPTVVKAQDDAPMVEPSVDYSFGQELRFNLQVEDASGVQRLTLFFRPELSTNIYEVDVPFQPGDTISVTQPVAVKGLDIRPYSDVTYSWEVQTAGSIQTVQDRTFSYEDDRFAWQAMIRDGTTAHWTAASPQFGQSVLDTAEIALTDLLNHIPLEKIDPIDIYIYPSTADIRAALRLAGLEESDTNQHDLGVLLITSVNEETAVSDLEYAVPYELAYLLLYRAAGQQINSIPWWLREGIAENARINSSPRDDELLLDAVTFSDTIPLWRLCDQPQETADRQQLAGIQSASLVRYLMDNRPAGTIPNLLSAHIAGDDCEQGVRRVLDYSLDELEEEWLADLVEPSSTQSLFNDAAPWILLLIGGTLLVLVVILATRKKE